MKVHFIITLLLELRAQNYNLYILFEFSDFTFKENFKTVIEVNDQEMLEDKKKKLKYLKLKILD